MPSPPRPLIVRLRNWVGDVTLGVPTLQRLADSGHALQLVGKAWARELLVGHGWPVHVLPKTLRERVHQLRELRHAALALDPDLGRRINAVCFPYSFSSALEFRLGRPARAGPCLRGTQPVAGACGAAGRAACTNWRSTGTSEHPARRIGAAAGVDRPACLPVHREQAAALRSAHGIEARCIVICPFAGGTWDKQDKTWPAFADFVAHDLPAFGRSVVVCPGPGEEAIAREHFASARLLPNVAWAPTPHCCRMPR